MLSLAISRRLLSRKGKGEKIELLKSFTSCFLGTIVNREFGEGEIYLREHNNIELLCLTIGDQIYLEYYTQALSLSGPDMDLTLCETRFR